MKSFVFSIVISTLSFGVHTSFAQDWDDCDNWRAGNLSVTNWDANGQQAANAECMDLFSKVVDPADAMFPGYLPRTAAAMNQIGLCANGNAEAANCRTTGTFSGPTPSSTGVDDQMYTLGPNDQLDCNEQGYVHSVDTYMSFMGDVGEMSTLVLGDAGAGTYLPNSETLYSVGENMMMANPGATVSVEYGLRGVRTAGARRLCTVSTGPHAGTIMAVASFKQEILQAVPGDPDQIMAFNDNGGLPANAQLTMGGQFVPGFNNQARRVLWNNEYNNHWYFSALNANDSITCQAKLDNDGDPNTPRVLTQIEFITSGIGGARIPDNQQPNQYSYMYSEALFALDEDTVLGGPDIFNYTFDHRIHDAFDMVAVDGSQPENKCWYTATNITVPTTIHIMSSNYTTF